MLILTRRIDETLIIGDDVQVTVLGIRGDQVRIGINAPRDIAVHREEVYLKIQRGEGNDYTPVNEGLREKVYGYWPDEENRNNRGNR